MCTGVYFTCLKRPGDRAPWYNLKQPKNLPGGADFQVGGGPDSAVLIKVVKWWVGTDWVQVGCYATRNHSYPGSRTTLCPSSLQT